MPHSRPAADSHEIRGLTGIRGLAAIMVASFHFYFSWVLLLPALSLVRAPLLRGYLGVDLFFMLSGFILSYVYHAGGRNFTGREYGRFLWFRLARLYPNHVGMLLLLIVLFYGSKFLGIHTTFSCAWDDLPFQLTLTQEWPIAPREGAGEWNFPAWSISAEWFAYLAIFPLVAFLLRRIRGWQLPLLLGGATVVAWSMVGPHLWPRVPAGAGGMRVFLRRDVLQRVPARESGDRFLPAIPVVDFRPSAGAFVSAELVGDGDSHPGDAAAAAAGADLGRFAGGEILLHAPYPVAWEDFVRALYVTRAGAEGPEDPGKLRALCAFLVSGAAADLLREHREPPGHGGGALLLRGSPGPKQVAAIQAAVGGSAGATS
jgi:hypothetical protein